jgi:hypothetical protein
MKEAIVFGCAVMIVAMLASASASNMTYSSDAATEASLWLAAASYCDPASYTTRSYKGPTAGFVATYSIHDSKTDTTGYIGYLPSQKSIFVVFRGSVSWKNWASDLDAVKTSYTSFPECNCQVHKGFYSAEQSVISNVVSEVKRLQNMNPGYVVRVAGHSLGAALAQLTGMDLIKNGISCSVIDFGQPRVGTKEYSSFSAGKMSTSRYTHNRDRVPHLPLEEQMSFYHVCWEMFENSSGNVHKCDSSCEDPSCADQFAYADTNWDDHGIYLGLQLSCAAVS